MANETPFLLGFDDDRDGGGGTSARTGGDDRSQPRLRMLKLSQIEINPDHPRTVVLDQDIATLASDIKQRGVQKPVVVRRIQNTYQYILIDGGLRFRAAQSLSLPEIPAHVIKCEDSRLVYMVLELTHKSLHPVDFAESITVVADKWDGREGDLADLLSKQQSDISRSRRISKLSAPVKAAMRSRDISFSVATEIASDAFADADRLKLLTDSAQDLTTEALRNEIKKRQRKPNQKAPGSAIRRRLRAARDLADHFENDDRVAAQGREPRELTLKEVIQYLEDDVRNAT